MLGISSVMIDADLARLFGVTTKRLNEQVKRNQARFPREFMFQLTELEKDELVANCDQFKNLKHSYNLPYAFTEHGALMLANVLSSPTAIDTSIAVVKAFVNLRALLSTNEEFKVKFEQIERKFADHDQRLKNVFDAIRQIMTPQKNPHKKPIENMTGTSVLFRHTPYLFYMSSNWHNPRATKSSVMNSENRGGLVAFKLSTSNLVDKVLRRIVF